MEVTRLRDIEPWVTPLVAMGVIFFFSAQPSLDSGLGTIDTVGRKIIHFCEYGLLCFLWWRALRERISMRAALISAVLITSAYAATDEWHQTFTEGRHGSPIDWAIDTAGALTAAWLIANRSRARA